MLFSFEKYWENGRDKSGNWSLTWVSRDSGLGKLCHLHNFPGSNFTCFDKCFKIDTGGGGDGDGSGGWNGGGVFLSWIIIAMLAKREGVPLLQVMFSFKTHNVSETGFCLQVGPTQLGPISRAGSYLWTPGQKQKQKFAAGNQPAWSLVVSGPMGTHYCIFVHP
jgi:hypothetical protein